MQGNWLRFELASRAVFLGIKQFGETRVFLKEREVLVISRMIAIFRTELDGDFQVLHCGIGLAGEAIQRCESVMNVVGFRSGLTRLIEAFASIVPSANIHHGHTALIMLIGSARILLSGGLHALLSYFDVHARTIRQLFAGAFENLFQLLLGTREFLLMKEGKSFVVEFELGLHAGVN